jgi:hypothetical protein
MVQCAPLCLVITHVASMIMIPTSDRCSTDAVRAHARPYKEAVHVMVTHQGDTPG